MVTKVFRVQDKSGQGPYWCKEENKSWTINKMQENHNFHTREKHPSPKDDPGIKRFPKKQEFCGFLNSKQLHSWFTDEELDILATEGFSVVEVEGEITEIGKSQILFILKRLSLLN